ncbi:MAG TPA: M14-type cytosolic carboxypeptidase [Dissulfurispiraceae bacterium]|nr:M14-type cytosolic carboxypeptidase [Dissulfurispiraceae bacterium]
MATITSTELIDGNGFVNLGQPDALNTLVARTYMYYGKPTSVENPGVLCIKGDSGSNGGPRFQISSSNNNAQIVTPTSGSVLHPSLRGAVGSVTFGQWVNLAASWDGVSPVNSSGKIYKNGVLETAPETSSGSSPYLTGAGYDFWMFNRPGLARATLGSHAYFAIWGRVLSDAEVAQAYADGPLSVPDGLVLCWANGQDYGPYSLTPASRSTVAAGDLPPNTALGESAPTVHELVAVDLVISAPMLGMPGLDIEAGIDALTASNLVASSPVLGTPVLTSGIPLTLVTSGDTLNAHPTNSSVTDANTDTPTVNVSVRVIYTAWRQFVFKLENASGKRPVIKITNPSDCVDTFRTSWRPWYSYDGLTWLRFDTPPVNNTSTWDFQHSAAFTGDDVWIAYQPAWPVSRAPWLIGELQSLNADLVHELSSAPDFEHGTVLTAQTDELGNAVPGQKMYAFGVWDDTLQPVDSSAKRIAVIVSGTHAGEHVGSWAMEGFVRFLFGGSAQAATLLRNFKFFIYPLVNPMGRYMGHYRGQRQVGSYTLDPNRDWPADNSASIFQSTQFLRAMMVADFGSNRAAFFADFHATWGTSTAFYYYNTADPNADYLTEWDARIKTYSSFAALDNTTATTIAAGVARTYSPNHCYIPETFESSAFAGGITDVSGVGEVYAKALADSPLSEMALPSIGVDSLAATDLVTGPPVLGTSALGQTHVLGCDGLVTGGPVFGSPSITQIHTLEALGLTVGVPVLGTPALNGSDIVLIDANEVGRATTLQARNYRATLAKRNYTARL